MEQKPLNTDFEAPKIIMGPVAMEFRGNRFEITSENSKRVEEYREIVRRSREKIAAAEQTIVEAAARLEKEMVREAK